MQQYDLAVIGAGWAGFNACLRAKELGLKAALIDKGLIGGTCLNRGCIPTKALIQSAKVYSLVKKAKAFGVEVQPPQIKFLEIQARKDKIIQQLRSGMQSMLGGVDFLNAEAQFLSSDELKVGEQIIKSKSIIIATGSRPIELKNIKFDAKKIISSEQILDLKELPKSLLIVGGGVIGCEFASLFSILGVGVAIAEIMPQLLPQEDAEVARKIETIFKKKGIKVNSSSDAASLNIADYELVLLCVGRAPDAEGLGLEKAGVIIENGRIVVDEYLRTNIPNIYAAGDCTGKVMLAHFAAYQGEIAAENIARGNHLRADNDNVPNCIFTDPEIASLGLSEKEALDKGFDIKVNKFDFLASGMARISDETEGFIKIVSDKKSENILGASIIGPRATELVALLVLAKSSGVKLSQIRATIFAHPTISESIREAAKN
jgi:dihydrolipoamide dehydrogenase